MSELRYFIKREGEHKYYPIHLGHILTAAVEAQVQSLHPESSEGIQRNVHTSGYFPHGVHGGAPSGDSGTLELSGVKLNHGVPSGDFTLPEKLLPYLHHINGCEYPTRFIPPDSTETRTAKCICGLNENLEIHIENFREI